MDEPFSYAAPDPALDAGTDDEWLAAALVANLPLMASWSARVRVLDGAAGRLEIEVPTQPSLCTPYGTLLGGVVLTAADLAAGASAAFVWRGRGLNAFSFATQDLAVQFVRPATGTIVAACSPVRVSDRRAVIAVDVSVGGESVAVGHASVRRLGE